MMLACATPLASHTSRCTRSESTGTNSSGVPREYSGGSNPPQLCSACPPSKSIAQRIATSSLVKTALFGRDANWGRVLAAAGSAPWNGGYARLDPALVSLTYNGTAVLVAGAPQDAEPNVDGAVCSIELDLGLGDGSAGYLTSDLSYDYVRINADYRS